MVTLMVSLPTGGTQGSSKINYVLTSHNLSHLVFSFKVELWQDSDHSLLLFHQGLSSHLTFLTNFTQVMDNDADIVTSRIKIVFKNNPIIFCLSPVFKL